MSAANRDLAVGDLSFRLEPGTGMLRALRFRGHEVLRGIYPAVRDAHWETLSPALTTPAIDASPHRLTAQLDARVTSPEIDIAWHARIEATADGVLRYQWRGYIQRDSTTNRTGLCVLHPAEAAGAACTVEHVDGTLTAGHLPSAISPHQPYKSIRAITHDFAPGAGAITNCVGEVFEMEDQRNWTDASFKTYCRPLDWPKPYLLRAGTVVEHVVTVTIRGAPAPLAPAPHATPESLRPPWPRIGFGLNGPLPPVLVARALALRPSHVRVETTHAALAATLAWARPEADALGCELELAILDATTAAPARTELPSRCVVSLFDAAGNRASSAVVAAWREAGFDAIGAGTNNHFAQLNRARPPADDAHHFTTFGINAQVHAFDDTSVLETLSQHAVVARQAAEIGAGRPVTIAPMVLGGGHRAADPRLHTEFGARWTRESLDQLARTNVVDRVTYFQLHGPGGILREGSAPTPLETLFATRRQPQLSLRT
jgi:hypothetical protein